MTAGAGATGARSWLATRHWSWLTPLRLRRITVALLALALVASTLLLGGSTGTVARAAATRDAHELPHSRVLDGASAPVTRR